DCPQESYPYQQLIEENARLGFHDFEYELLDTGIFEDNHYFDVVVEYAKVDADDIFIRISVTNRADVSAPCTVLPTLWFRNTWSWGYDNGPMNDVPSKPCLSLADGHIVAEHPTLGTYYLYQKDAEENIFTENESNTERLYNHPNETPYVKDAFHEYIINNDADAVNPKHSGTKASFVYHLNVEAGATEIITLRLSSSVDKQPFKNTDKFFQTRIDEADTFYDAIAKNLVDDEKRVQRQALAGMLWTKQLYYYDIEQWLAGDPLSAPPRKRKSGRNNDWQHLNNFDIISMPDKWEYPWYAGWDLAFHCIPLAMVDIAFAKHQLILLTHEWYMHPNGQLPAYEWKFGDVNPPVHAWATWHVYQMDDAQDTQFLKRIFNKMLLNFTWWVNRKDEDGNNVFQGGFLGLDNISLFDRSAELPTGGHINQSDGTAWMGFYSLVMMNIALELAKDDSAYEDMAVKFYEHFLWIAKAIGGDAHGGVGLWDTHDGFFYDVLQLPSGQVIPLKVRSLVGLMPLIAVETVGQETLDRFDEFSRSIDWLTEHRPKLAENLASVHVPGYGSAHLFAMPTEDRLRSILSYMLDEDEFLSDYGIRSLSKAHETPYQLNISGQTFSIQYWAAESQNGLFGGNSNWRGPIWFPINYLLIEALRKYYRYYGNDFMVECPTGSGNLMTLNQVADEISQRLSRIFLRDTDGKRPVFGGQRQFQEDDHWRNNLLFYEYFHGDNGAGLGASHQTGWTGLIAELLSTQAESES
ncbi:MAG: glucosidase, partial [Chloroflexota bacterium]